MAANNRNLSSLGMPSFGNGTSSTGGGIQHSSPQRKRGRPPNMEKKLLQAQAMAVRASAGAASSSSAQQENPDIFLPISRIRTIMKSSPDVVQVGHESLLIMTKATELFIQHLARESFTRRSSIRELEYRDLAGSVQDSGMEYLHEILPHKVKVRDLAALANSRSGTNPDHYDDDDEDDDYSR